MGLAFLTRTKRRGRNVRDSMFSIGTYQLSLSSDGSMLLYKL